MRPQLPRVLHVRMQIPRTLIYTTIPVTPNVNQHIGVMELPVLHVPILVLHVVAPQSVKLARRKTLRQTMEWTPTFWELSVSLTAGAAITQTPPPSSVSSVQPAAENAQTAQPTALAVQLTKNYTEPPVLTLVLLTPQ